MSITLLKKKSYLAMICNAARGENHMFRNLYALVDGVERDILRDGTLSCNYFVFAVLYINKLIGDMHVGDGGGLEKDLITSGWEAINTPKEGAVLLWEKRMGADEKMHGHSGFFIGNDQAISNSSEQGFPVTHHWTYDDTREVEKIYWHSVLDRE
jgi:hypothetical protein